MMDINIYLKNGLGFEQYMHLTETLVAEGKSSGLVQSEEYIGFTKLNLHRMQRIYKTATVLPELSKALAAIDRPLLWFVLTETWCGDAAQNLPLIQLMAERSQNIELRLVLRDENPELMNSYLTNGARSIPKLICLDKGTSKELFVWGPRPAAAQQLAMELKAQGLDKAAKSLAIQKWYIENKGHDLQEEFRLLLEKLL